MAPSYPHEASSSSVQIAHTLTACTRCRQRKTRCDPGLPRCGPCERTGSVCEYYDTTKCQNVDRSYVVFLQHRVRELEEELERVENDDTADDPEAMMRAANVRVHEAKETKFLGPSSGIAITRLVMQLAKQFTDASSIKEIVPEQRARQIKELYHQEQAKPTSKIYPLVSDVPAPDLPNRALTGLLVQLYKLKVQPMYPALHEPTLDRDVEAVYSLGAGATPFQHFVSRMVIAISLQKFDAQYAGLADSYYLAALGHMEAVVKPMDLQTLQCFALMAEYSLLTPTRTAIYYIVGIAVRLAQALRYNEEKTIVLDREKGRANVLEIDMRRRLFWCILVMELGLSHSLGRPAMLATSLEGIDVAWFETCDDEHITPEGIDPAAQRPTLKKWIAIHFFKMRLLQLEIRRKLYLKKRPRPQNDADPWFAQMEAKLNAWRDAAPSQDGGFGLDKIWFIGRYNTMIVFLYRPSPQVPRPSLQAALKCFDACEYNIYMQREQITRKNVDLTWIFTQSIFMAINTMLWSLSYEEVRRRHKQEAVEKHLEVAMDAIQLASERWPGVASAVQLYQNLIRAILKIYEKDGDVPISAASPPDVASPDMFPDPNNRSRATSPATVASSSVATPPLEKSMPFGYAHQQPRRSVEEPLPQAFQGGFDPTMPVAQIQQTQQVAPSLAYQQPGTANSPNTLAFQADQMQLQQQLQQQQTQHHQQQQYLQQQHQQQQQQQQQYHPNMLLQNYDPYNHFNRLPEFTPELTVPGWNTDPYQRMPFAHNNQAQTQPHNQPVFDPNNPSYSLPGTYEQGDMSTDALMQDWDIENHGLGPGLNIAQQEELMLSLATDGMEDIQSMISNTISSITPKTPQPPTF